MTTGYDNPHIPNEITRVLAFNLNAVGVKHDEIARRLGISDETLRKHYRDELDASLQDMNINVMNVIYKKIIENEDVNAAFRWLKCRAGWKEAGNDDENKNDVANYLLDQLRKKDTNAE